MLRWELMNRANPYLLVLTPPRGPFSCQWAAVGKRGRSRKHHCGVSCCSAWWHNVSFMLGIQGETLFLQLHCQQVTWRSPVSSVGCHRQCPVQLCFSLLPYYVSSAHYWITGWTSSVYIHPSEHRSTCAHFKKEECSESVQGRSEIWEESVDLLMEQTWLIIYSTLCAEPL